LFRQHFRREVRQGLYVLHFASSGEEGLQMLTVGIRPELIVILFDINIPGMDRLTLLRKIKERWSDPPVMMVTAYGDDERRRQPGVHGAVEFIAKPVDFDLLKTTSIGFLSEGGTRAMEEAVESARGKGPIAALYIETPANPTNGMVDLERARKIVSALRGPDGNRPVVVVDNTLLGPIYQTPLAHGADLVVTSLTKYVGGHSDLIAGGCSGAAAVLEPIRGMRTILGTMCDPHTGWLLMRSLETLKLRMTAAAEGAHKVAAFLNSHPKVASVWYLGFLPEGHPDRPVFERQCKSPGSTFSFEVRGGEAEAFAVLNRLKVIKLAVSLGGTETLASHPAAMTHSDIPEVERLRLGITPMLIRISVGIEDPDDLIADLNQALD
jgi:methionine-gamma-lyase